MNKDMQIQFATRLMFLSNSYLIAGYSFAFTYVHLWLFREYLNARIIGAVDILSTTIGIVAYWAMSKDKYLSYIEKHLLCFIVCSSVFEVIGYVFYFFYPLIGFCMGAGLMTASRAIASQGFQTIINCRIMDTDEHKYRTIYQGKRSQATEVGVLISASLVVLLGQLPVTFCTGLMIFIAVSSVPLDVWLLHCLKRIDKYEIN